MTRSRVSFAVVFSLALICVLPGIGNEPPKTSDFMQLKLQRAQKVLEGIVQEDYKSIEKHSQSLILLSHESNWNVFQTVDYNRHSTEFRRSAGRIRKAAEEKNLDGAALAYLQMTMNCVNCHKYVRGERKK